MACNFSHPFPVDVLYQERTGLNDRSPLIWLEYVQAIPVQQYSSIVISLGANDAVELNQIQIYQHKAEQFIQYIKQHSQQAPITWILPPVMKEQRIEGMLKNTREAIKRAVNLSGIYFFDPQDVLGNTFTYSINGVQIRTQDGIHYTAKGSDLIINELIKSN
ncbi:GDSL-type esterase/lipase family protein [Photorhabdus luminescens]|uniref:Uncharacterized protein n=1 Tax=Photorhabdus luminescens subsp. mexicana TaxID=2100167 RepID=A0A4R4IWY6_PHOLU|nr:hypothetical protein C5468_21415 [Photorhabdus luminescens subsp. mexicana]